jgi:hypothetical protein
MQNLTETTWVLLNIRYSQRNCLFCVGFLLGLLFGIEIERDQFSEKSVDFHQTPRRLSQKTELFRLCTDVPIYLNQIIYSLFIEVKHSHSMHKFQSFLRETK